MCKPYFCVPVRGSLCLNLFRLGTVAACLGYNLSKIATSARLLQIFNSLSYLLLHGVNLSRLCSR